MPDTLGALEYHERTKHSSQSVREEAHRPDFENKPVPYKRYVDRSSIDLPDPRTLERPALEAIAEPTSDENPAAVVDPDLETLATLCHYTAGITKRIERHGETLEFRAAATTGALYHIDLYLVCGDLESGPEASGLEAGVYHYDPQNHALDVLRTGDHREALAGASVAGADAPLSIVATSTWWRNAWKYRERTFRHAFWDSGTHLANLLAVAHALEYRAEVLTGFADEPVADLLGVDPEREAPLEIVPIGADGVDSGSGGANDSVDVSETAVEPIDPETEPLSPTEREFPMIEDAWRASTLEPDAVADWRAERPAGAIGTRAAGEGERIPLEPVDAETASSRPLSATIERRGSCREYAREPVSFRMLSTVLDRALRGAPMDVRREANPPLAFADVYLLANGVEELEPGAYQLHATGDGDGRDSGFELERLRAGTFRQEAGHLALDQRLGADAAACVFFLTDLEAVVDALGDRGYRVAQHEAALAAGRLYLATYAHRILGGTGLTFYDDEVTDFFSPRAAGQTPLFLYTLGRPA